MNRPTSPDELFVLVMTGMADMRDEMKLPPPTKDAMAAVWAWARRAANAADIERSMLENVMDGQMWADWQQGQIVFRLTPAGIAHVEGLIAAHPSGSIEGLMDDNGLARPEIKRVES